MTFDETLLIWINQGWADPGLDFIFQWVSSRVGFSLPLLFMLLLIFRRRFQRDGLRLWLLMVACVVTGDLLGNLLKQAFSLPRPCFDLYELLRPLGGGAPKQCQAPISGMPSNHALNFFAVATFVGYALRRRALSLSLFGIALLVGVSRIYLAKHYPSQVLVGALLGVAFGFAFAWIGLRSFAFGVRLRSAHRKAGSAVTLAEDGRTETAPLLPLSILSQLLSTTYRGQGLDIKNVWMPLLLLLSATLLVWWNGWNSALFLWLNQLGPATSDQLWSNLTLLGDTLVAFAILNLFTRQRPDIVGGLFLAALFATLWAQGLKPLLDISRPLAELGDQVHVIGQALRSQSFPSGHATTAFTLAGVIILRGVHPLLALIVVTLAVLAALSRAVVGAHWPLDIMAGAFGGWLSAALGVWLAQYWRLQPGRWLQLSMLLFLTLCAGALLITRELGYPQAIGLQILIGLAGFIYGWVSIVKGCGNNKLSNNAQDISPDSRRK